MTQRILREPVFRFFAKMSRAMCDSLERKKDITVKVEGEKYFIPYAGESEALAQISDFAAIATITQYAKSVVFRSEQAQVFTGIHKTYFDSLDYKLPFDTVFLQFDHPVSIDYQKRSENDVDRSRLIAVALEQTTWSRSEYEADKARVKQKNLALGITKEPSFRTFEFNDSDHVVLNRIAFLYEDWGIDVTAWQAGYTDEEFSTLDETRLDAISVWKNVAIACIGYINCENIYLHRQGEVPESVNAKRERKGKSRLEPYYVCRIRGVQYDNAGNPTGEGAKHGIRYDVRGHFRRLTTGKTTWVRPHQRGLENELYVPKTYLVDRREPV